MTDPWGDSTSNPLEDIRRFLEAGKTMCLDSPLLDERLELFVVPTAVIRLCVKHDGADILWEYGRTVIATEEGARLLRSYYSDCQRVPPGHIQVMK